MSCPDYLAWIIIGAFLAGMVFTACYMAFDWSFAKGFDWILKKFNK